MSEPLFISGAVYQSKTHGLVVFRGLDSYMGQTTLHFCSAEYGDCYWLPEALSDHLSATDFVRIPKTREEASLMVRLGTIWLQDNQVPE